MDKQMLNTGRNGLITGAWIRHRAGLRWIAAMVLSLMAPSYGAAPAGKGAEKGYSDMDDFQRAIVEGTSGNASTTEPGLSTNAGQQQNRRYLDLNKNGRMDAYEDPELLLQQRVEDLLGQMTLEEINGFILQRRPAVPRLGIPLFNWRQEANRGLIGYSAVTVWPTPLGIAASFNPELVEKAASDLGDEVRALVNRSVAKDPVNGMKDGGLCVWSPIVDLGRDPRWGRLQESNGEDPFLSGILGAAYCRGVQGRDPNYIKVIAEPKHFVANGTGYNRHTSSSNIDERNLREYYLPPFEYCVKEGKALAIMAAYNAVNKIPCPAHEWLLTQVLRKEWGFPGIVISDCGAVYNIHGTHKYAANSAEAVAKALKAGCDVECGADYEKSIGVALEQGLITQPEMLQIARRVLPLMFRLGLFDPPERVPYTRITPEVVDSAAHRQVALEMARQSMTLLKNDANLLPLDAKKLRSVAVIGPYATQVTVGLTTPTSSTLTSPIKAIADQMGIKGLVRSHGRMEAADFDDCSSPELRRYDDDWAYVGGRAVSRSLAWRGTEWLCYRNVDFTGLKRVTLGMQNMGVDFTVELRAGKPDGDLVGAQEVSFKQREGRLFDIEVTNAISGIHDLYMVYSPKNQGIIGQPFLFDLHRESAGGAEIHSQVEPGQQPRLSYAAGLVVPWGAVYPDNTRSGHRQRGMIGLTSGQMDTNRMMLLEESPNAEKQFAEAVELARTSEVAIVFAGFDERHSYEGDDRNDLNLPGRQGELIKAVAAVNPNTIVVLKVGGPVAGDWVKSAKAILCAWYVGQDEGQPIAEALFGRINPSGHSAVTWYNDARELPDFNDYDIRKGRTYQYFKGTPLFAFGHGLSYTTFEYGQLKLSRSQLAPGQTLTVELDVKNTGSRAGDDVVQLYVKEEKPTVDRPIKELKGFSRVSLQPGESKTVKMELPYRSLAFFDDGIGKWKVNAGNFMAMVGESSADIRREAVIQAEAGNP